MKSWEPICPILFDGRVPPYIEPLAFDRKETPFDGIRPRDMKWSSIITFPVNITPSFFDIEYGGKPMQLEINDKSIIRPPNVGAQFGYRRSTLIFAGNTGDDKSVKGVKSFHWSVRQGRPLNLSHEYVNVYHERKDEKGFHFTVKAGKILNHESSTKKWKIMDHADHKIFETFISNNGEWENFAIRLDFDKNTIQVFYSIGQQKLIARTPILPNVNTNGGFFHVGMFKKSTKATNPTKDGYHAPNTHESQIYGGIFIEDSSANCVSGTEPAF